MGWLGNANSWARGCMPRPAVTTRGDVPHTGIRAHTPHALASVMGTLPGHKKVRRGMEGGS
eukprot:2600344-Rhodomonas_salina.1